MPAPYTLYDVVTFVDQRKAGTKLGAWSQTQLGCYIFESFEAGTLRVADNGTEILGVLIFNPSLRGQFWVEQVWGNRWVAMKLFVQALVKEYPEVSEVWGQRGNRAVKFNLVTLIKIYGRRS